MKALEILKDIQDSKWCGVKITLQNISLEQVENAIKELKELQQSNKDLLNTVIEAQRVIKNVLEFKK